MSYIKDYKLWSQIKKLKLYEKVKVLRKNYRKISGVQNEHQDYLEYLKGDPVEYKPPETLYHSLNEQQKELLSLRVKELRTLSRIYSYIPERVEEKHWKELIGMRRLKERFDYIHFLRQKEKRHARDQLKRETELKTKLTNECIHDEPTRMIFIHPALQAKWCDHMMFARYWRALQFVETPRLVIDCRYLGNHSTHGMNLAFKQLMFLVADNRRRNRPWPLYFVNFDERQKKLRHGRKLRLKVAEDYANITDRSYTELFPKELLTNKIIYLSPHATETLTQVEPDACYVIGGIVDRVAEPNIPNKASRRIAEAENLRCLKLPLDKHLRWQRGNKMLTITSVAKILQDVYDKGENSWLPILEEHIPLRKLKIKREMNQHIYQKYENIRIFRREVLRILAQQFPIEDPVQEENEVEPSPFHVPHLLAKKILSKIHKDPGNASPPLGGLGGEGMIFYWIEKERCIFCGSVMVPPIPVEHREEIVKLRDAGYSFRSIREALAQKGVKYSVIGIGNCYQKIVKSGSIESQPKQKYSKDMLEKIKSELQTILEENSDLTGQQQIDELKRRLGVTVSMDAVGRYRRMLGWKVMPMISNKKGSSGAQASGSTAVDISPANTAAGGGRTTGFSTSVGKTSGAAATSAGVADGKGRYIVDPMNGSVAPSHPHTIPPPLHSGQLPVGRASGYYLQPPDVVLPPGIELPPGCSTSATTAIMRTVTTGGGSGVDVKSEYAQQQIAQISQQLQQHPQDPSTGTGSGGPSSQGSSSAATMPTNTAIVYPLTKPTPKFGKMHVFTSRSFIRTAGALGLKYQVWAGISFHGATSICIWDANCRMRSNFYCNTILEKFFLPFRAERYRNERCIIVQSNDTIYRSNETKAFMEQNGITAETWIAGQYGGENNPIELIWEEINDHIRNEIKPSCLDELREAICNFWATRMTDSKCMQCLKKCSVFSEF